MLEIFICEDDKAQREKLTDYIQDHIVMSGLDMRITISTSDPKEIIEYVKNHIVNGLFFLDVDLQAGITGIELAAEIREYDTKSALVFITTHPELMSLTFTYKVEAMDYIAKGDFAEIRKRIVGCIRLANKRLFKDENKKKFQVKNGNKIISEEYANIMFFETSPNRHRILLHARNRQVEFYGNLNDVEELDSCLYRSHRSYVVNKENITEIDVKKCAILMVNGEVCYASVRLIKKLLKETTINQKLV